MEPNPTGFPFGIGLYLFVTLIVAIVAAKRGRSGVLTFLFCVLAGFLLNGVLVGIGASLGVAGVGAFAVPVIMLLRALSGKSE